MATRVTLIRGDGIGPEVVAAAVRAVEATGASIEWEEAAAGAGAIPTHGAPLPEATLESIRQNRLCLKGPLATPIGGGYRSVNVALRQEFDLYANVRPARTFAGLPNRYDQVDLVVVRENTQGEYSGIEHYIDPDQERRRVHLDHHALRLASASCASPSSSRARAGARRSRWCTRRTS